MLYIVLVICCRTRKDRESGKGVNGMQEPM